MTGKPTYEELERRVRELERAESGRKQTEEAQQASDAKYRTLFESVNDAVLVHRIDSDGTPGKFIAANRVALDRLGYTREDLLNLTPQAIAPDDVFSDLTKVRASIASAGASLFETVHLCSDGRRIPVESHVSVLELAGERIAISVVRDLSERKQAEEALRERAKELGCLQALARVVEKNESLEGIFQEFVHAIPNAWHYPEIACARILCEGRQYQTENFRETDWRQSVDLKVMGKAVGIVELCYLEERPLRDEGPFLKEERTLINLIGERLGRAIERKQSEEALEAERAQLKSLFDYSQEAIVLLDLENHIVEANSGFERIFGYSPEEARGRLIEDLICPERFYHTESKELDEQSLAGIKDVEIIRKRKEGEEIHVIVSAGPIKIGDNVTGRFVVFDDITDRKLAEEALRESEEKHRCLFETMAPGVVYHAADGAIISANPAAERILGLSLDQMRGKTSMDPRWRMIKENGTEVPGTDHPAMVSLRTGETFGPAIRGVFHPDKNTHVWLSVTAIPLFQPGETKPFQVYATFEDITERKRAGEELRESERQLDMFFSQSLYGFFMCMLDEPIQWNDNTDKGKGLEYVLDHQRMTRVNQAMLDQYGATEEDFIGITVRELFQHDLDHAREIWRGLFDRGNWHVETREQKMDGTPVIIDGDYICLYDEQGRITGHFGVQVDITVRKRAEEERERLQAQLHQAQKMESIGILAGGIAHNFNNILMGIQGRASLMMMDKGSSHADHEHLRGIEEYIKNALELTKDLLGFARGGKYEVKPTDMNDLIKHENRMFGRTKKEIRVQGKYEKDLWTVEVDPGQMRQALLNLYVNAWQAMPGGGTLYVQTENVTLDQEYIRPFQITPGRYVKVSVTDTGVGMDDATLEKVFDPFFSTKDTEQGFGLGLASVYGIIKNHGGFINVYSEKETGTTFTFYLPASEKEAVKEGHIPELRSIQYGSGTVLLVDDEEMIVNVGQQMLERLGYQVLIARSGEEAMDLYGRQKEKIDLVILDMIMPGMGGGTTYDRLKEIDGDVRVLLSSGYSVNGQAKEILDRGCIGFIQKPFTMEELSRKVKEVFDR